MDPKSLREALVQGYQGSEAERHTRQIVTFYSCRGGVGRTMALCNVASYLASHFLATGRAARQVLCVDLAPESAGVSAFLPPGGTPSGGLTQLFIDFAAEFGAGGGTGKAHLDWLEKALNPGGAYVYQASPGGNLWVLSAGVDLRSTTDSSTQERLARFRLGLPSGVATVTVLQEAVRSLLRERYAYTLIDCCAGEPGLEFALANVLSDALAVFFRPNFTQLFGVKRALATFLGERGRRVTDFDAPVVPVLSPRPAHSDPRLRNVRRFAGEKMFRWLDPDGEEDDLANPHPLPRYGALVELPFDSTVEVGESLLIDPKAHPTQLGGEEFSALTEPDFPEADDGAPLFLGYRRLAGTLQKANFRRDAAGARLREEETLSVTDHTRGLQYHFCALETEPDRLGHWRRLWDQYRDLLGDDGEPMRQTLREYCVRPWEEHSAPVAYVMSRLWLADFVYEPDERTVLRLLGESWQCARLEARADLLREVLRFLGSYLADHPAAEPVAPLPMRGLALDVYAALVFGEKPQANAMFDQLCVLEKRCRTDPQRGGWLEEALCDQLRLASDGSLRAVIFADLGNFYRQSLRLPEACWAYCSVLEEKGAPPVEIGFALDRLRRLLPLEDWKALALPHSQDLPPRLTAALNLGTASSQTDESGDQHWGVQTRVFQTLELLRASDLAGALALCLGPWGATIERLPLLALVLWLQGDRHAIPRALVAEALDRWDGVPPHPRAVSSGVAYYLLAAWAGDPEGVATHAVRGLEEPNWPMGTFWYLFFAASGVGATEYRRQLRSMVVSTPLLARWVVGSEIFFLYRRVWAQQGGLDERAHGLTTEDIRAFDEELDFLEAQAKRPFLDENTKRPEVGFVGGALEQMAARWRRQLQPHLQAVRAVELLKNISLLGEP